MQILVTGGAGYIGSHTCVSLLEAGHTVIVADNLCNSKAETIDKIKQITNKEITFYKIDVTNEKAVEELFKNHKFDGVIHFAGLKAVGESVSKPLLYYSNNLVSTMVLSKACLKYGVSKFVFSSSATVYGENEVPFVETMKLKNTTNPYGETKAMSERILSDVVRGVKGCKSGEGFKDLEGCKSGDDGENFGVSEDCEGDKDFAALTANTTNKNDTASTAKANKPNKTTNKTNNNFSVTLLRYFNPVGAHKSGLIGEDPTGIPNNLMPYVTQVAKGKLNKLRVFGDDYPTVDGTGVRDYIHVVDLAEGHVKAIEKLNKGVNVYNLGTGRGTSVLELVKAFEEANNIKVPYEIVERRPGDIAECYADVSKAERELGWVAKLGVEDMCKDARRFARF